MAQAARKVSTKAKSGSTRSKRVAKSKTPRTKAVKKTNLKKKVSNSPEVITQLVTENQEHGMRLAWSFLKKWRIRIEPDEVESVVGAALVEAAIRYDDTKGAHFRTFFFYHLRGMLLKEVAFLIDERKRIRHTPSEVLENPNSIDGLGEKWPVYLVNKDNPETLMAEKQESGRLWKTCEQLDSLEREVIERHFIQDHSLKKIAEDLSYCRCHISRVKSKALKTLSKVLPGVLDDDRRKEEKVKADKRYTGGRGRRKSTKDLDPVSA